jgi:hypothetical protein
MSYDRQLEQVCTHLVVEEYNLMRGSRQIATPMRPISSINSVVVRVNGVSQVPSFGVDTPAQSSGSRNGPFTITSGVNDTLRIRVNNGPYQTVVIPASKNIQAKNLALAITSRLTGVQFFSERNLIKFRSNDSGPGATIYISSDSTLAAAVGIQINRQFKGKNVFPGWSLVNNPNTLSDRPTRMIIFDEPLRADLNFLEINYTTIREECRRCGGLGVENDWRYAVSGEVVQARDEFLLIQELQKIIYTIRGTNSFNLWYGTTIIDQIGEKLVIGGVLQNRITSDIHTAFNRWQSIKKQQEENVGQLVTDEEYPYQLQSVTLEQSQDDPTVLFVNIIVANRSLKQIQLVRGLRIPLPDNILGSTQQQAIIKNLTNFSLVQ